MIAPSADWKNALAQAVRDPAELLDLLELPQTLLQGAQAAAAAFPLRVPRGLLARMERGNPNDPILRQVLGLADELEPGTGFSVDPVGDLAAAARPGLLHKYRNRALLVTTGACAVHCRYCFRRHFPYSAENPAQNGWREALDYLKMNSEINEIILSGGDPLMLDDDRLAALAHALAAIPHLRRLRLHTRMPVVLPERVVPSLTDWLCGTRLQTVMVLHINHPQEIDKMVGEALARLRSAGVALFNQAVLLRGVNDDTDTLCELSDTLFQHGITPYYLHLLDRVTGAAHFDVPEPRAVALLEQMRIRLSGYLVPRLVRETAGDPYKLLIL